MFVYKVGLPIPSPMEQPGQQIVGEWKKHTGLGVSEPWLLVSSVSRIVCAWRCPSPLWDALFLSGIS